MSQDTESSLKVLSVQEVLDYYKNKHYSCTPEELNTFSMKIIADYLQKLDRSAKKNQIVDEDGFITVVSKKQKRTKSTVEPVFTPITNDTKSNASLYVKSRQTKKQQYKKDLEGLQIKFSQDQARMNNEKSSN